MTTNAEPRKYIIAIDGPAGAGKSTTARLVASQLHFTYLDTGALYRALTYMVLQEEIDPGDEEDILTLLNNLDIRIESDREISRVWVNGREITAELRKPRVNRTVSSVARHAKIRKAMVQLQRRFASRGSYVVEGRDIGTVVFPDADLKIFLRASLEARTARRLAEMRQQGEAADFEQLKKQIAERDRIDSERAISPLRKADDAIELDTTSLSISEQVEIIVKSFRNKVG